ncbi:5-methyltetrahydropteroyltriglutamate--homocysteine methyltransferase [Pseudonocardia thermophila]|uniref:5-methyltetrahydropteroyltriglutamate--homocysteine methyltransferase n=1 Tax=Pseudonocardia thermophila TaxID=1848 RepID=A0A1M6NQN8_PSETH|nr:5-methyltetrahydropteroyltriglutamate--homocysteine methyltransferase [Pseudonocardia thermophila]SHJ97960.1 5-methyltetrahydropteroyltriglutamate--homocysteine methyltransferase [Pseudonocardia thermophila]
MTPTAPATTRSLPLLPTMLVGSYPQPDWLIDRRRLASRLPPRVRARELWRPAPEHLAQAQDDATELAIRAQERAGLDVVTDGEVRRESYSNHFAAALEGLDLDHPGTVIGRAGTPTQVPRVVGPLGRPAPVQVRDLQFLRSRTDRAVKITVPGPFTMTQLSADEHYGDPEALAMAYAELVNAEVHDLFAAGAGIVQIDEPYLQARPDAARAYGLSAVTAALSGITGTTAVHLCFGYAALVNERPSGYSFLAELADCPADQISIETAQSRLDLGVLADLAGKTVVLGVIDLSDPAVEPVDVVADRVRRAFRHTAPAHLALAPDCGMKYLPRASAEGKMRAMAGAAALLRTELDLVPGDPALEDS